MKTELVTTLKRKATDIIATVRTAREPVLITAHGKPAAYLVDVATYEATERRLSILEGIAVGEQAIREGRITSHADAKKRLSRWLE
jgi:prevent-host-death family protein